MVSGSRAYLAWSDDRNTSDQIWASRVELDSTPPSAPANLTASGGDTSALLEWRPASDSSGISGYHVLGAASAAGPFVQITPQLVTASFYRDVGLAAGSYVYQVVAYDGTGNPGAASNQATATVTVGSGLAGLSGTVYFDNDDGAIATRGVAGGDVRAIAKGYDANPTPDGKRLFYLSDNNLIARDLASGTPQMLYTDTDGLSTLDVTGDGTAFAALHRQFLATTTGVCYNFDIRLRTLGSLATQLYETTYEQHTALSLSDDKRWIASTYAGFCNYAALGSYLPPKLCITDVVRKTSVCTQDAKMSDPSFAPNSRWLAFVADYSGQPEVWKAYVGDDGRLSQFTQLTRSPANQPVAAPAWSSDGSWLVFARDTNSAPGDPTQYELLVVRSDGDGLRPIGISAKDPAPAWIGGGTMAPAVGLTPRVFVPAVGR